MRVNTSHYFNIKCIHRCLQVLSIIQNTGFPVSIYPKNMKLGNQINL
nr:MAG TPA: hypothetical protein [Caudoviricetes sp.]